MDMAKTPLFQALTQRMKWLSVNQETVATNISQADTPGYRPKRMKEQEFSSLLAMAESLRAPRTNAPVMPRVQLAQAPVVANDAGPQAFVGHSTASAPVFEEVPDGNAVILEEELLEMANIQMEYGLMTNLYRRHMSMLRTALGKGNG